MKRTTALLIALCLMMTLATIPAALAYDPQQDAMLKSGAGSVTLYQKANGAVLGTAPSSLRVWYDIEENNGEWVHIYIGGSDRAGTLLDAYVRRGDLIDVDGVDLDGFNARYPEQVPKAVLEKTTDVFALNDEGGKVIGQLPETLPVSVLVDAGDFSFIQLGMFSGYVPTAALKLTGETGDLKLDVTNQKEAKVYCAPGDSVPVYSSCMEMGEPPQYSPIYQNGDTTLVLRTFGEYTQVAHPFADVYYYGGFIPTRFFEENGDHEVKTRAVRPATRGKLVNLRYAAKKSAGVVGQIAGGAPVQVLSDDGSWSYIRIGRVEGYMMNDFLVSGAVADSPQMLTAIGPLELTKYPSAYSTGSNTRKAVEKGAEVTLLGFIQEPGDTESWMYVYCDGFFGYSSMEWLRPVDDSHAFTAKVTSQSLNLRESPDKESYSLTRITKGKKVTVLIRGVEWSYIRYEKTEGFVMSKYLEF